MPIRRRDIERELHGGELEKATGLLHRALADFADIERELQAAERRAGLAISSDMPLLERMARLGFSERDRNTVAVMLAALWDMRSCRPISEQAEAILAQRRAAKESADRQLAAVIARRRQSS